MKDGTAVAIIISTLMATGFGLAQLLDKISLGGSNVWAIIFLIAIGVISWFLYQVNTNGFELRKAKNRAKVDEFWEHKKTIEVARQLESRKASDE